MTGHEIPGCVCTSCGHAFELASSPGRPDLKPSAGAVSVCIRCGNVDLFTENGITGQLSLRPPAANERSEILADPDVVAAVGAVLIANALRS